MKRYLHEKSRFIAATEHEHVLIVPGSATNAETERRTRVYTIASPVVPRSGGYRVLLDLRAVGEVLDRERPDLLESADPYQVGWYLARATRMLRIPAVAFYHSHFPEAHAAPIWKTAERICRPYVRALYNRFATTITASSALAATLREWGVERVAAVGLGVDPTVFHPGDEAAGRERERLRLLYVGRLAPEKNTTLLVDTFEELNHRRRQFDVVIVGDGPDRARIETLKAKNSNVRWLKYCEDRAELARYYRAADLFVHPGVRETFGLAALEAQACGTPVVGIAGTRMDEAILHDQSWWALQNTARALGDAIERASTLDLRAIGAAASRVVREQFTWQSVFERLLCIYREVCTNYIGTRQ